YAHQQPQRDQVLRAKRVVLEVVADGGRGDQMRTTRTACRFGRIVPGQDRSNAVVVAKIRRQQAPALLSISTAPSPKRPALYRRRIQTTVPAPNTPPRPDTPAHIP